MKKVLLSLMAAGLLIASLASFVVAAPGGITDKDALKDLAAARQATVKYHDVSVAEADGYVSTVECVEVPGLGGMGIHYVNFGLMDPVVDLTTPEVLLYAPTEAGVRLVGVEYFAVALYDADPGVGVIPAPWIGDDPGAPPPGDWVTTAPTLFGQTMELMAGHESDMPWHYDLHVWLWQGNPDGMFADFNPNVSCP
jgi:hypothetical protein